MGVLIADLRHFLDLPDDALGPSVRLAEQLTGLVRAATARRAGSTWETPMPCRHRPNRQRCPGRLVVARAEVPPVIRWLCTSCGDSGEITGWERSWADLRPLAPAVDPEAEMEVRVPVASAVVLRDVMVLDPDCERTVHGAMVEDGSARLAGSIETLEELLGCVAAEANAASGRGRQRQLEQVYAELDSALAQAQQH